MSDADEVLTERGKTHGKFDQHARLTQNLKRVCEMSPNWMDKINDSHRESIHMICHKLGRILAGNPNHADHWVDIAGYAQLVANELTNPKG